MLKQGLVAFGALAIIGCGGGDPLGEGDSQIAWEATQGAMGGAGSTPGAISTSVPCADGGSVKWKYSLLGGLTATSSGADLEYTVVFKGCKHDGVKISGKFVWTLSTMTSDTGSNVRWGYEGDLRYSGDIKGSCEYSMFAEVNTSATGVGIEYSGSICGNDASATLNVGNGTVTNNVNGTIVDDTTGGV